jgi:thiaminase
MMSVENIKKRVVQLANTIESVDWLDKKKYGNFLAQSYYYVRHSTRILALAASRFSLEENESHQRFLKHMSEENQHEKLLTHDLKNLNFKINDFPEQDAIRSFYQIQFYTLEHISPISVMGFVLALEGLAVQKGEWLYKRIAEFHGEKAGSFLRVHGKEDIKHFEEALHLIMNRSKSDLEAIDNSMATSCYLYERMLLEL